MRRIHYLKLFTTSFLMVATVFMVGCSGSGDKKENSGDKEITESPNQNNNQKQNPRKQLQRQSQVDTNVSDKKLKQFSEVGQKMQEIQRENRPKMQQAIKDVGLSMDKFQSIMQQQQKGGPQGQQQGGKPDNVTEEEMKKFREARQEMKKFQEEARKKMKNIIEESELTEQEYRRISRAVRQSKSLQNKMRDMQEGGQRKPQMQQGQ